MSILLEIAANSFQSCMHAQQGGADRIELFENLGEGGCTPSYGMLSLVKEKISIPVYIMIRPRGGDFMYSDEEFEIMYRDIEICKKTGFSGIVFGVLDRNGNVDIARCKKLLSACGDMKVTFHRAFDRAKDLHQSIRQLIDLGFARVLTSGGEANVEKGKDVIKELQDAYGKSIIIMPGCGVTSANARAIANHCGVHEIHATAKGKVPSGMQYTKTHFTDEWNESNIQEIKAIKQSLL
jgi:copper homeostasis protein